VKSKRPSPRARRLSLVRWLALTLLVASAAGGFAASPTALDATIRTIRTMQAPRMVGDTLILTYRSRELTRFVGARFQHERWAVLHTYSVNEYGVFVLDYPVPAGASRLSYRIVADGLWMADPSNPVTETDGTGTEVSVFELEAQPIRVLVNPDLSAGRATFVFKGTPGSRVSLVGNFNGWDPFAELLAEVRPGEFQATIDVRPGRHYYCFYAGGRKVLDPWNSETGVDPDGRRVNSFSVPY